MNNKTEKENMNELGERWFPRALSNTKNIRKAGADIFANFGAEQPGQKPENIQTVRRCFPFCSMESAQNGQNLRTNGWAPYLF